MVDVDAQSRSLTACDNGNVAARLRHSLVTGGCGPMEISTSIAQAKLPPAQVNELCQFACISCKILSPHHPRCVGYVAVCSNASLTRCPRASPTLPAKGATLISQLQRRLTTNRTFSTVVSRMRSLASSHHVSPRQLIEATFNTSSLASRTRLKFLLPHRRKLHQIATLQQEPTPAPQFQNNQPLIPPEQPETESSLPSSSPATTQSTSVTTTPPTPSKPLVLSKSLQTLLPALHAQPPHYITTHIHRFPYLLTAGDTLRLPFHLHGVSPGDILRFNRASLLGSRDYTLKAGKEGGEIYDAKRTNEPLHLDERLFECRLRVLGVETQPMMIKEKKKRRIRRVRTVKSKHKYTVLKVMEVKVKSLEELRAGKDVLLLE